MSKQAGKESVFLTTKVRTKLKGDGSWLQRRSESQDKTDEEKPWLAEVRAGRLNGEPVETSPAPSPTTSAPPALKPDAERSVVTKLDSSTSSSTSNGVSQTAAQFPKKPSESYKKIAPYTVRPTAENQEAQLSSEEQEKRTEAASSVLMKSTVRQRSYVLSAAKKYESQDKVPETSLANSTPAFVARRVEIVDEESAATPAPVSKPPPSPAAPVTSVASAPEPQPLRVADTGVKSAVAEPVALKVVKPSPGPVKDDPPPGSVAVKDPSEDKEPGSTKGATPLPVLIPECFQAPKASAISGRVSTPLVDLTPAAPSPAPPTPAAPVPSTPVPLTPSPVSAVKTEAKPELVQKQVPKPRVEIVGDESAATPAPVSKPPPSPAAPVTSVASAPEPQPLRVADTSVKSAVAEPVALKVVKPSPGPVKDDPPPGSVAVKDPSEDKEPGSTKGATPLPVLIPECFQAPKASAISGRVSTPLVDLTPAAPSPAPPTPAAPVPSTPVPLTPSPVSAAKTEAKPDLVQKQVPKPRADTGVKSAVAEPVALKVVKPSPGPVKDDPPPGSVAVKDPSEDKEPGSTKGATPLPVLIPECFQAPKASAISERVSTPLVDLTPAAPSPAPPTPAAPVPSTPVPLTPSPVSAAKTEAKPDLVQKQVPKPRADTSVKSAVAEPVALKVVKPSPGPVKDDPPPGSVAVKDPSEDKEPGSTKGATPLPVLIPECFQAPKASAISGRVSTPLVDLTPAAPSPAPPTPAAPVPSTPVPLTPSPVSAAKTEAKPDLVQKQVPKPRADTGVKSAVAEPVALKVVKPSPGPVKDDPPPGSVAVKDPSEDKEPGSTKGATPLPVLIPECFQAPKASAISGRVSTPLVDLTPAAPSPAPPTPAAPVPSTPVPLTPSPVSAVKTEAKPELVQKLDPKPSSRVDTLTNLSNTLITFNSSSSSFVDDAPVLAGEEAGSANSHTSENGDEEEPAPELSSWRPITDDLLAFTNGPKESRAEPVPPSPGRWSQDLLSGLNSASKPKKTSGPLDFLANDVIPINTEARSLSTQLKEKQTDETARETQSLTETVTITTQTVIITDKSSADPFDPYPIGTTSSNSSSDLLQPGSDISSNSISSNVLDSHSNLISINTDATSGSTQRSWARSWRTSPPQEANTEESQEALPAARTEDQELLVRFERKSAENDSPWDKWTSPTVYTLPVTTEEEEEEDEEEEEEEEEESTEYTRTQTVTNITTFRERSEEQSVTDRYETYSRSVTEEEQRVTTPEPEARRGFVYLKEYVNATELSSYNVRDTPDCGSDYVTSSSTSYSYNSPSTYSSGLPSSSCNFCGEPVGNDAKITIEHLNINCHPHCFKCGVCKKPMGDLLDSMFLHGGKVHCEICYSEALD